MLKISEKFQNFSKFKSRAKIKKKKKRKKKIELVRSNLFN